IYHATKDGPAGTASPASSSEMSLVRPTRAVSGRGRAAQCAVQVLLAMHVHRVDFHSQRRACPHEIGYLLVSRRAIGIP
ncbi:MAG: hypothetical protein ACREJ4_15795, partial [Candidatus Methylomirabilaceae bacterium]